MRGSEALHPGPCCGMMLTPLSASTQPGDEDMPTYIQAMAARLGKVIMSMRGGGERRKREWHLTLPGVSGSLPGGGDSWKINLNQVEVSRQI